MIFGMPWPICAGGLSGFICGEAYASWMDVPNPGGRQCIGIHFVPLSLVLFLSIVPHTPDDTDKLWHCVWSSFSLELHLCRADMLYLEFAWG